MEEHKTNHKEKEKKPQHSGAAEEKGITLTEKEYLELKGQAERAKEYWDRLLRLQADFENTRKRLEREKIDFMKFASEGLILELLNILDDLERAVELAQTQKQELPVFLKGIEMILAHLYEMLKENGVKPIDALGKAFDPNFHEALMQTQRDDLPEHTVVEELQKGYTFNDKVIRTTKAKVSKKGMGCLDKPAA